MVKILRSLITLGAGALAYKAMTKKKIFTDENIRNGTIGAVGGMVGVPELEKIIKGDVTNTGAKSIKHVLMYGALGAGLGYVVSSGKHVKAADYAKGMYEKYLSPDEPEENS